MTNVCRVYGKLAANSGLTCMFAIKGKPLQTVASFPNRGKQSNHRKISASDLTRFI